MLTASHQSMKCWHHIPRATFDPPEYVPKSQVEKAFDISWSEGFKNHNKYNERLPQEI